MKNYYILPGFITLSLIFSVVFGISSTTNSTSDNNVFELVVSVNSPTLLTVTVPWASDTTYVDCVSDIPPVIDPDVSSTCIILDTTLQIQTIFGSCINKRTIIRTWTFTDSCMDIVTVTQVIIVDDSEPPEVIVPWPDTLYLDCLSEVPEVVYPLVSDNCGVKDTSRFIETTFGPCANDRFIRRTWTFRDSCDNETTVRQVIYVKDSIPPEVIVPWPDTLYLDCLSEVPEVIYPLVSDNCGVKDTSRFIETTFGPCANDRFIRRTWTFRDSCDNATTVRQVIYVKDSIPPEVIVPWPDTLYLDCLSEVPEVEYPLVSDNCGVKDTSRIIETTFGPCNNDRFIRRTWRFRDSCDNETIVRQIIIVEDTIPPEVIVPWTEDTLYLECLSAVPEVVWPMVSDNCGVKDSSRVVETTFGPCNNDRFIRRTWRFRDSCDNEAWVRQVIIVEDTIPPEVIVPWTEDTLYLECLSAVPEVVWPLVSDNCGVKDTSRVVETTFGACANDRFIRRTWRFRDSCDNEALVRQVIIVKDTIPPEVIVPWTEDTLYLECLSAVPEVVWPLVSDNCGVKDTSRVVETTFGACANDRFIRRTWRFRDSCDNEALVRQVIIVKDTIPPEITVPWVGDTLYLSCATELPEAVSPLASDNCGIMDSSYVDSLIPGVCANRFTSIRTWTYWDTCMNESKAVHTIIIDDDIPPDISACPAMDTTIECGPMNESQADAWNTANMLALQLCATDNCANFSVSSDYNFGNLIPDCGFTGSLIVSYTITDECSNSNLFQATLTIEDTTPPELSVNDPLMDGVESGDTVLIQCYGLVDSNWQIPNFDPSLVITADDCDDDVGWSFESEVRSIGDCVVDGYFRDYGYTWTATDDCDNVTVLDVLFRIIDTIPPVLIGVPDDVTVSCTDIPDVPLVTVLDECQCFNLVFEEEIDNTLPCMDQNILYRTWTGYDCCGNSVTAIQTITLVDNEGPVIVPNNSLITGVQNGDIFYYDCNYGGIPGWYFELSETDVYADDACSQVASVKLKYDVHQTVKCESYGYKEKHIFSWVAEDACGNISVFGFEVHLIDEVPPIIVSAEDTICLQVLENTFIVAYDECGTAIITRLDEISNGDCGMEVNRRFEVIDECGNKTTFDQFIYVMEGELSGIHFIESIQEVIDAGDSLIVECNEGNSMTGFGPDDIVIEGDCSEISGIIYDETILETYNDCFETGIKYAVEATWTIEGLCGGESTISLTVYIKDTTAPTLVNFQKEAFAECGYPLPQIIAIDNCGDVDLSITEDETTGSCPGEMIIERQIIATDDCGNQLVETQIISVVDTKGPVFVSDPYSCYEDYGIEVFDECTGEILDPDFLGVGEIVECEGGGVLVEHYWVATDACGNTTYFDKYLLKDDILPPEILITDAVLKELVEGNISTVYTSQTALFNAILHFDRYSVIGYDNCDIVLFPAFNVNIEGNDCEKLYSFRWDVFDYCGNSDYFSYEVLIIDDIGPMVINPPNDTTIFCGDVPDIPEIKGRDNFSDVTIVLDEEIIGDINHSYDIIRQWILSDECGNKAIVEQIVSMVNYDMSCEIQQMADIYCASHGNEICADVIGGVPPYTYQWSIASGVCVIEGNVDENCIETYVGFETVELSLIVTDANGCETSCSYFIECIDDLAAKEKAKEQLLSDELIFEVYPNPVINKLTISYILENESAVNIQFYNSVGKLITSDIVSGLVGWNNDEMDVTELNPGIYYIHLNSEGKTGMKKFIRIE